MNWLTTKVMMPLKTAMAVSKTSATAPPRGAPRPSSQSTAGSSKAHRITANATGTTITSRRAISQTSARIAPKITSRRQDQAAALRTNGSTASSSLPKPSIRPA